MNSHDPHSTLTAAGWTNTAPGLWKSPVTGRVLPERTALSIVALPSVQDRHARRGQAPRPARR